MLKHILILNPFGTDYLFNVEGKLLSSLNVSLDILLNINKTISNGKKNFWKMFND